MMEERKVEEIKETKLVWKCGDVTVDTNNFNTYQIENSSGKLIFRKKDFLALVEIFKVLLAETINEEVN